MNRVNVQMAWKQSGPVLDSWPSPPLPGWGLSLPDLSRCPIWVVHEQACPPSLKSEVQKRPLAQLQWNRQKFWIFECACSQSIAFFSMIILLLLCMVQTFGQCNFLLWQYCSWNFWSIKPFPGETYLCNSDNHHTSACDLHILHVTSTIIMSQQKP